MASYYGVLFDEFWTGRTGRDIRRAGGRDAQVLAAYLISNRHANMLGLYRVAVDDMAHDTGMDHAETLQALRAVEAAGFARYDHASEFVWVLNMFRFRLGLEPGQALRPNDKRVTGANRLFQRLEANPFLASFYIRTKDVLLLQARDLSAGVTEVSSDPFEGPHQPPASPLQAPSEGLARPIEGASHLMDVAGGATTDAPLEGIGGASKPLVSQLSDHRSQITGTHTDRAGAREVLGPRLMGGEHRAHAHCGRICVPAFLHRQFKDSLGGDEGAADTRLRDWYARIETALPEDEPVPTDVGKFWRPRFDAEFVAPSTVASAKPVSPSRTGAAPAGKYAAVTGGLQ